MLLVIEIESGRDFTVGINLRMVGGELTCRRWAGQLRGRDPVKAQVRGPRTFFTQQNPERKGDLSGGSRSRQMLVSVGAQGRAGEWRE